MKFRKIQNFRVDFLQNEEKNQKSVSYVFLIPIKCAGSASQTAAAAAATSRVKKNVRPAFWKFHQIPIVFHCILYRVRPMEIQQISVDPGWSGGPGAIHNGQGASQRARGKRVGG